LIKTTIEQAPRYETLSYVWGKDGRSEVLTLKDGKFLSITKLLQDALPFVERECQRFSTRYLWVDQICIDQDDRNERSHQVKLMGQIYTSCFRVLVWPGRMTKFDAELFSTEDLERANHQRTCSSQKKSTMEHIVHHLRKVARPSGSFTGSSRLEMLQSKWFHRAWVFQEIVLPQSAQFILTTMSTLPHQARTISLSELHKKVKGIDGAGAVADTIRMMYQEQRRHNDRLYSPIEQTLSHLAPRAKVSEQLDRLYAFFGLNFDAGINLTPSYDSPLEVAMMDTATSIIEGTCSLDIFEVIPRAVENTKRKAKIPTWTPDFREEHLVMPFKRSNTKFRQRAQSSPDLYPQFITSYITYYRGTIYCAGEEKRMIQAHGFVLDYIETEIGALSSRTIFRTGFDSLLGRCVKAWNNIKWRVENKVSSAIKHPRDGTGLAESTIYLGFAPIPTEKRLRQALIAEGCCALSYEHLPPYPSNSTETVSLEEHIRMQVMHGRTLWMTRSGRFALGSYLRCGDRICLAYGCSNPIALRGEKVTKVLGTCFLEEWMDPWSNGNIERAEEEFSSTVFHMI